MINNIIISIIIPVYNVEKFLEKCIESVLYQSFSDFELILVNDGSTDSSGKICDNYALKDSRIRVLHKENAGVSSARNIGINEVKGEWIYFVDSDDTLQYNALYELINYISNDDIDLIMAGYNVFDEKGRLKNDAIPIIHKLIPYKEALIELYSPTHFPYQGYLWCKLFRSSKIKELNLKFNENIYFNEDRLFIAQYLCFCKSKVAYTTTSVYNYMERKSGAMGSLTTSYNKKYATDFDAYILMYQSICDNIEDQKIKILAKEGIINSYIQNHNYMIAHRDYDASIHRHMIKSMIVNKVLSTYLYLSFKSFIIAIKSLMRSFLLLIFPSLILKIKSI